MNYKEILKSFNVNNVVGDPEILEGGNINSSYVIYDVYNNGYVIQMINKNVFKNPVDVMDNIELITSHILSKNKPTLRFLKTSDKKNYIVSNGEYYRVAKFIKNSKTVANVKNLDVIEDVGRGYGEFQNYLSDLDSLKLKETIKDFHNTPKRFNDLKETIKNGSLRYDEIKDELNELLDMEKEVSIIKESLDNKSLPYRTTHNDTKANNVLFDKITNKLLCVIDLDTVMPGSLLYDFGDSIRSIASVTSEDSTNISNVSIDLDRFKAYSKGFIEKTKDVLTKKEIELMPNSVLTMTAELAVRFYDDYLKGDTYFKISYEKHNLVRSRCMLALAKDIKNKLEKMKTIIDSLVNDGKI